MKKHLVGAAVSLLSMVVSVGVSAAPSTAAAGVYSAVIVRDLDGRGSYFHTGQAAAEAWEGPATAITLTEDAPNAVTLASDGSSKATVSLTPASGAPLAAGTYALAPKASASASQVSVHLRAGTSDNNDFASGTLRVLELTRDAGGTITSLAADLSGQYTGWAGGELGLRSITLRYQSGVEATALHSSHLLTLGNTSLGQLSASRPITLTVRGQQPITFGTAYATVNHPDQPIDTGPFLITADGCGAKTLSPGQSCVIEVAQRPWEEGDFVGVVVVPDETEAGRTSFPVDGGGYRNLEGRYHPVTPTRIHDSRTSNNPIGPKGTRVIQVGGRTGIVTDDPNISVALSVTAVDPSANGYLTVWSSGGSPYAPNTSSVNFRKGVTRANLVVTGLSNDGHVEIYNAVGTTHVVVDVVGWFGRSYTDRGSLLEPLDPTRILDTRTDPAGAFAPGEMGDVALDLGAGVNPNVTAVALNITAVAPTRAGHIIAWDGASAPPNVSSLNFTSGMTVPVLAFVPVSHEPDGTLVFTLKNNSTGSTHLLADIVGYYDEEEVAGLRFWGAGGRILDTRNGTGGVTGAIGARTTRNVSLKNSPYLTEDMVGIMANVTAVYPTTATHLIAWDNEPGYPRPDVSNLNAVSGDLVSNAVISGLSSSQTVGLYNNAGSTHLVADLMGAWYAYPGVASGLGAGSTALSAAYPLVRSDVSRQ